LLFDSWRFKIYSKKKIGGLMKNNQHDDQNRSKATNLPVSLEGSGDLAFFLRKTGAAMLPIPVLVGAMLEIVSQYNTHKTTRTAEWHMVGESFLKGSQAPSS
jgi:hypothetical protein